MEKYRFDRQDQSFKGIKRVVTAQAGPYTSLQLPVVICNEQYKSVIDVGLPTSLISTAVWQKVNSPLYPISESDTADRVARRTNLQLMGYTHFQLQVGQTVVELEDALVYDFDEPEIFLSISAVAALGLIIDFQEGTFGLRSTDGLRCSWNEDTVLFPDSNLGNFSLLNKQRPSDGSYFDYTGSMKDSYSTSDMLPYAPSGSMLGNINQDVVEPMPVMDNMSMGIPGIGPLNFSEMGTMMSPSPMELGPMTPAVNMGPLHPYSMGFMQQGSKRPSKKMRKSVNLKKFKNFYLKNTHSVKNSKPPVAISKLLNKIANWKKDNTKEKIPVPNSGKTQTDTTLNKNTTPKQQNMAANKNTTPKQQNIAPNKSSTSNGQVIMSKNQKRRAKQLQAQSSGLVKNKPEPSKPGTNTSNKSKKGQKSTWCLYCQSKEHTIESCKKPFAFRCVYCGQTGHLRTDCPTVLKTSSITSDVPVSSETTTPKSAADESLPSTSTDMVKAENAIETSTAEKRPADSAGNNDEKRIKVVLDSETPTNESNNSEVIQDVITLEDDFQQSNNNPDNEVGTENDVQILPKPEPLAETDDSFKKPEIDLIVRVPVKRVVAKKNIKLNMLSKNIPSPVNPDVKEENVKNSPTSIHVVDISQETEDALAESADV